MPTYQYYCPDNHQTLEVMHGMTQAVTTWGELCALAERSPAPTPADTPVEKLLGAGMVLAKSSPAPDACFGPPPGGGCCGSACGAGG